MNFDLKTCQDNYYNAEKNYNEAVRKHDDYKKEKKVERFNSLDEKTQKLVEEYRKTYECGPGFGAGLRRIILLAGIAIALVLWFAFVKNTAVKFFPYTLISILVVAITAHVIVFILNKNVRAGEKKRNQILSKNTQVVDYFDFCQELESSPSNDINEAAENLEKAKEDLYLATNMDTVFIYAHESLTNDSITLYKYLSLYIDGVLYRERMTPGVTKIKLAPGYHSFRFVAIERGFKDTTLSELSEVAYGTKNNKNEFFCQIDTTNRHPAGIIVDKKGKFKLLENLMFEEYNVYFDEDR